MASRGDWRARWPSSLSRPCRAVTRAQMSCAEVSRLERLGGAGTAGRSDAYASPWASYLAAASIREQPDPRSARARASRFAC